MKNTRVNLEAKFDARASFYGKAKIERADKVIKLYSYNTFVAYAVAGDNGKFKIYDEEGFLIGNEKACKMGYSQTTTRHIKEFFRQFNNEYENYVKIYYGI